MADLIEAATATAARAAARSLYRRVLARGPRAARRADRAARCSRKRRSIFPTRTSICCARATSRERLASIRRAARRDVLARARAGALLREGLTVVLVGAPNVGKSSLLNRLVGEDAAIVTPIPGTTRDTVERQVEIAGIPLTVVDTAGLRETDRRDRTLGIARTRAAIARADLRAAGRRVDAAQTIAERR